MKTIIIIFFTFLTQVIAQEDWEYIGRMPKPVAGASAVSYGNKIYILGGYSDSTAGAVNWIQSYDPVSKEWIAIEKMLTPRFNFSAGVINQTLYYCCGSEETDKNDYLEKWNFNLSSGAEIAAADSNFNRGRAASVFYKNYIYLLGGASSFDLDILFRYDTDSGLYAGGLQNIPIFIETPVLQMSAVIEDQFYFMGGVDFLILDKIFRMDVEMTNFNEIKPEILRPRAGGTAVSCEFDKMIYLVGGYSETITALSSVDIITFSGGAHEVKEGPRMIFGRKNPAVVKYEEYLYVFGGFDAAGETISSIEKLFVGGPTNVVGVDSQVKTFSLKANYPNPFNPSTNISFTLNEAGDISLEIFSADGQKTRTLNSGYYHSGEYNCLWDGKNDNGNVVNAGVYFYRLRMNDYSETKKMILIK